MRSFDLLSTGDGWDGSPSRPKGAGRLVRLRPLKRCKSLDPSASPRPHRHAMRCGRHPSTLEPAKAPPGRESRMKSQLPCSSVFTTCLPISLRSRSSCLTPASRISMIERLEILNPKSLNSSMAHRISDLIIQGELYHTLPFSVHGIILLRGCPDPIAINLTGEPSADLAARAFQFHVPQNDFPPTDEDRRRARAIKNQQVGTPGEMTAAHAPSSTGPSTISRCLPISANRPSANPASTSSGTARMAASSSN